MKHPAPALQQIPRGIHMVQADAVAPQAWRNGGGQTRELLAWPPGQDWQLRISRADIAADGPFSAFPGVDRWFTVLEGAGVALHFLEPVAHTVTLHTGNAPLHFDGGAAPGCTLLDGATQDLNLMSKAGRSTMQIVQDNAPWTPSFAINGLYTAVRGTWRAVHANATGTDAGSDHASEDSAIALPAHTLLWCAAADSAAGARWTFVHDQLDISATSGTHAWWLGYTPDAA